MILVPGATGNAGKELVRTLVSAGEEACALIRRGADRTRLPADVEGFVGDLDRPETLSTAPDGMRGAPAERVPGHARGVGRDPSRRGGARRAAVEQCGSEWRYEQRRCALPHPLRGSGARVRRALDIPAQQVLATRFKRSSEALD
jgi:uncharacterized protein YbjT (DUF2867 family)